MALTGRISSKGKRLIGMVLVCGLIAGWGAEAIGRRRVASRYKMALAAQRQLEHQLSDVQADHDRVFQRLTEEQARTAQLSSALSAKDQDLQQTVARLTQEERFVQELQERLLAMQRQFDLLQGELALTLQTQEAVPASQAGGMVELEKIVVASPSSNVAAAGSNGRVISVHPEWRFVVIDLGWDDVKLGDVVSIYRQEQLLGKARIERVQEQVSAATLFPEWNAGDIQVNDTIQLL